MVVNGLTYAKAWRGIVPLQTTRTAVEQRLGKPAIDHGDTVVYDFENERASIEYSKGPCSVKFSQWNVPRDTVITVWVTPKTDLNIKDVRLGRSYKMVRDEHRLEVIHYIDKQAGIEYNVDEASGIVGLIKYQPTAGDKTLRCLSRVNKVIKPGYKREYQCPRMLSEVGDQLRIPAEYRHCTNVRRHRRTRQTNPDLTSARSI